MPPLIGSRLRRLEDPRLITGAGRYAGDVALPGLVHLAVFRSPLAQARIRALDLDQARAMPGVLAAWTVENLPDAARGFDEFAPRHVTRHPRPVLASGTVHTDGITDLPHDTRTHYRFLFHGSIRAYPKRRRWPAERYCDGRSIIRFSPT